ncbi:MAG TPA: murein L,D-transpeptidase catalytic domain family protein, partial [Bdellovibrionota bacterium]|nr:murein L,D-transpeptidase catalytic domain family protein [Bdellovibrionota bacterium]
LGVSLSFTLAFATQAEAKPLNPELESLAVTLSITHSQIPQVAVRRAFLYYQDNETVVTNRDYVTIIDFTLHSSSERMYVIDMRSAMVDSYLVAHGRNSGLVYATEFSNIPGSLMSSLGIYVTGVEYEGQHGRSMRLHGMEATNSAAEERAIVLHAADYVSYEFIRSNGYLGRSWGCPVIEQRFRDRIVSQLKDGSVMLIHRNAPPL